MDRLTNKVALVIGGASGIGLAIANRFSQEGAEVFVTGRREPELLELAQPKNGSVHAIRADAADLHDLERVSRPFDLSEAASTSSWSVPACRSMRRSTRSRRSISTGPSA